MAALHACALGASGLGWRSVCRRRGSFPAGFACLAAVPHPRPRCVRQRGGSGWESSCSPRCPVKRKPRGRALASSTGYLLALARCLLAVGPFFFRKRTKINVGVASRFYTGSSFSGGFWKGVDYRGIKCPMHRSRFRTRPIMHRSVETMLINIHKPVQHALSLNGFQGGKPSATKWTNTSFNLTGLK